MKEKQDWLTVKEGRELLGVSDTTMRRLIESGKVQWRNLGVNKTQVWREDLEELLKPRRGVEA